MDSIKVKTPQFWIDLLNNKINTIDCTLYLGPSKIEADVLYDFLIRHKTTNQPITVPELGLHLIVRNVMNMEIEENFYTNDDTKWYEVKFEGVIIK